MDAWQLSFEQTLALVGFLLLAVSLSSAYVQRLPISTAAIYLVLGTLLGPYGFNAFSDNISPASAWFERTTEIAVIASLFVGGLKLRLPFRSPAWVAGFRLAGPVMLCTIALLALFACCVLQLDVPTALLLGAIIAPTDPVLASAISIHRASDDDSMRFALSGEAGLNDGMAFPFVILGLSWTHQTMGPWIAPWILHRLLWAVPAGLVFGYALGWGVGRLAVWLRSHHRDARAPTDFLAMALIALSYVGAETIGAWGFLATFAAGLGLRGAEVRVVRDTPHPEYAESDAEAAAPHPPAEMMAPATVTDSHLEQPAVAAGVLIAETITFGETLERLLEVVLVVLVGMSLATHWDTRALGLALVLFLVIRPLSTRLSFLRASTSSTQRFMLGLLGIRGIGSLYYLSYALRHGLDNRHADELANLTISVVAVSIVVHGVTSRPLLMHYEAKLRAAPR